MLRRDGPRDVGESSRRLRERQPAQLAVETRSQVGHRVVGQRRAGLDESLVDAPGVGDQHRHQTRRRQHHELDVAHPRRAEARVLGQRHLVGELGEHPHGARQHVVEIDRIAEFTTYNGMHLLDSVDEYTIQAGASEASNDVLRIAIGDMRAMGPELNLDPVTADTLENSQDAIDRLEMARLNLTSKRNHIAALHNRLELSVETAASITASMLATESNVRSADFAQTLSSLTSSQIMMQTAGSLAYEADIDVDRILSLLQQ